MTKKHEIEIEGLPEGYELGTPRVVYAHMSESYPELIKIPLKKIKPGRSLEETGEERSVSYGEWYMTGEGYLRQWTDQNSGSAGCLPVWREVKKTDASLTNEVPKLSLSADECKEILHEFIKKLASLSGKQ